MLQRHARPMNGVAVFKRRLKIMGNVLVGFQMGGLPTRPWSGFVQRRPRASWARREKSWKYGICGLHCCTIRLFCATRDGVRIAMTTLRNPNPRLGRRKGNPRRDAVLETAKNAGLLAGANGRIAARIRRHLVNAAKARSGIKSDTELLEYALARVALEDDFGQKLIIRQGRVPRDVDLEF